jgi:YHS domain-containing protein
MKKIITTQFKQLQRKIAIENVLGLSFTAVVTLSLTITSATAHAQKYHDKFLNNVNQNGVILDGYDPVAFFTDSKPVKGNPAFAYKYEDAIYQFASQQHLDMFKGNPEKYKPQFGAWCAYAVSLGRTAPIDVKTFSIVNGRLVIQHNEKAVRGWNEDVQGNLKLADKYWPKVSANGGKQIFTDAKIEMIIWIAVAVILSLIAIYFGIRQSRRSRRNNLLRRVQRQGMRRKYAKEMH